MDRDAKATPRRHRPAPVRHGGSFLKNWQTEILDPLRKKTGINCKMVSGSVKAHAISLLASKGSQPPFDVFLGNGDDGVAHNVQITAVVDGVPGEPTPEIDLEMRGRIGF